MPPEKKEKKRLRLSMPTINGFFSSWRSGKEVGMRERGVKRKAKEIEIRRNERN